METDTLAPSNTPQLTPHLSRPKYFSVTHKSGGAYDRRGRSQECEKCLEQGRVGEEVKQATWTGMRRPTARIMVRPFAMCEECWKKRRME